MTPATKKQQPKTIANEVIDNTPVEITRAIAKREAEALARKNKYLAAYVSYIEKAARGEPIEATDGDAAVLAAAELGIKASRIGQDIAYMQRHIANEKRRAEHLATSAERKQRIIDIKEELRIHERLMRELRAEGFRIENNGVVIYCEDERRQIQSQAPHLFASGIERMSDQELAAMRQP